jgi:hypothetical protein
MPAVSVMRCAKGAGQPRVPGHATHLAALEGHLDNVVVAFDGADHRRELSRLGTERSCDGGRGRDLGDRLARTRRHQAAAAAVAREADGERGQQHFCLFDGCR